MEGMSKGIRMGIVRRKSEMGTEENNYTTKRGSKCKRRASKRRRERRVIKHTRDFGYRVKRETIVETRLVLAWSLINHVAKLTLSRKEKPKKRDDRQRGRRTGNQ